MLRNSFKIPLEYTIPKNDIIITNLGIPSTAEPDSRTITFINEAIQIYKSNALPYGLYNKLNINEFESIFTGENLNESEAPLGKIYTNADQLALFVVTVGFEVCDMISKLFAENDFVLASILDITASEAVELAEKELIKIYLNTQENEPEESHTILPFSPGYCGWDITSQKKLFEYLKPEEINVKINESCLMSPLKSISGVLVTADKKFFEIYPDYPFCNDCKSQSCIERTSKIFNS